MYYLADLILAEVNQKAFAVFVEPLTQIDLIAKYPLQLYGTNAIIGVVNACIVTFSGLVIGVKGMATPIAGAIVLFDLTMPQNQLLQSSSLQ